MLLDRTNENVFYGCCPLPIANSPAYPLIPPNLLCAPQREPPLSMDS